MEIRIKWLTVTCFEMQLGDTTIVSDPFIGLSPNNDLTYEAVEKCDFITLSHCHWDHITDIKPLMEKFHAPLLTGTLTAGPMLQWLDVNPSFIYPMDAGLELDFETVKIKALFGRHTSLGTTYSQQREHFHKNPTLLADPLMESFQPLGTLEYRNFLYTCPDGTKILMWGNDPTYSQRMLCKAEKPDIAIVQLSKQDPVEMAEFVAAIGSKVVIPHHMDLKKTREEYMPRVLQFREEYLARVPDGRFLIPENGKWMQIQ